MFFIRVFNFIYILIRIVATASMCAVKAANTSHLHSIVRFFASAFNCECKGGLYSLSLLQIILLTKK